MSEYGINTRSLYEIIDENAAGLQTKSSMLSAPSHTKGDVMNSAAKATYNITKLFGSDTEVPDDVNM